MRPRDASFAGVTVSLQGFQIGVPGSGPCLNQIDVGNTLDITIR